MGLNKHFFFFEHLFLVQKSLSSQSFLVLQVNRVGMVEGESLELVEGIALVASDGLADILLGLKEWPLEGMKELLGLEEWLVEGVELVVPDGLVDKELLGLKDRVFEGTTLVAPDGLADKELMGLEEGAFDLLGVIVTVGFREGCG